MTTQMSRRFAVAVATTLLVVVAGCGGGHEVAKRESRDVKATVAVAQKTDVPQYVSASGSLAGENTVQVSTRLMGWITAVPVREGTVVRKGELLVQIGDTDLQARRKQAETGIDAAKAVLENAGTNVARFEKLYEQKSVSKARLDDVHTGRDQAAAGLAQARAALAEIDMQLSYLAIKAPVDGTVVRRMVDPGDMANPGQPLLTLEQVGTMKVTAGLSERDVDLVKGGERVTVEIPSLPIAPFTVPVARVVPAANTMSHTYDLQAYLPNTDGQLKSGMFARVLVPVGTRAAVLVPKAAIMTRGQLTGVWTVDNDGIAHLHWIRTGRTFDDRVEVISGLTGSETVVLTSEQPLTEGDRVVR